MLVGMEVDAITLENGMESPQKKKRERENYYVIQQSHFWIHIQRKENYFLEDISALLCSLRYGNNFSIHQWINKIYIYTHIHEYNIYEYYSTTRKKKILSFVTWVDLEGILLSYISHIETNTAWYYLSVESFKNSNWQKQRGYQGLVVWKK